MMISNQTIHSCVRDASVLKFELIFGKTEVPLMIMMVMLMKIFMIVMIFYKAHIQGASKKLSLVEISCGKYNSYWWEIQ